MKQLSEKLDEMYRRMGQSGRLAIADKLAIRAAIDLAKRVESAKVGRFHQTHDEQCWIVSVGPDSGFNLGQRVVIVPIEEEGE